MAEADYFVSDANRAAHDMVFAPHWPKGKLVLSGPTASGKSHLAGVWARHHGGRIIQAQDVRADMPLPDPAPTVVEDVDRLPREAEEWLFHLHNSMIDRAPLLLTARCDPARWPTRLPDLSSRLQSTTLIRIGAPDDALLTAVLMKQFADRQIAPDPDLPAYLATRLERSFAAVAHAVAALDQLALQTGRPVGRRLASDWLCGRLSLDPGEVT